ncbi:hypothetical protein B0A55_06003 [Friedmanniomyces simplex]|uniref:F-box domain-containing protein n=1 Tax=Friedmanniomyces simplex TaxID=329884 RepID=A0A4U0XGC5_9PEZI|nr:hypothetical protein B0A55_06003 [Friedmanniomyces simplex]
MNGAFAWILAHPTLEDLHLSSINIPRDTTAALNPRPRTPLKRLTLDEANVTLDGLRGVMSIPIALEYLYIEQAHPPGEKYNRLATRDAQAFIDIISLQKHSLETFTYICNESTLSPRVPWTHIRQETDLSMFEVLRQLSISGCNHSYMMTWCARCKAPPRLQRLTVDELVYIDVVINEDLPPNEPPIFIKEVMAATPHLKQLDLVGTSDDFDLSAPWMVRPREATAVDGIVRPVLYGEREPENVLMYVNDQQGFRVANMDDWLPPEDETSEDDDFAFGDVLGGTGDEEEDDEEETSEEEDVDDDDEE